MDLGYAKLGCRLCADFMFAQIGLGHGFADGNRINFAQFAVVVEEQTLLRNIDNDVLSGRGGETSGISVFAAAAEVKRAAVRPNSIFFMSSFFVGFEMKVFGA